MLSDLFFSLLKVNAMATIVAIIVLVLKYILKKCGASRKLLFYLWIIIALRFVCPNFLESNFSLFNIFDTPISEENQVVTNKNNQVNIEDNIHIGTNIMADDTNINNVVPSDVIVNSEVDETIQIANAEDIIPESQNNKIKTTDILMIAWITGSCFMILYALISYLKLKKTVMFAVKGDGDYYETDMISTPCVVGIIKPKIYLTLNLTEQEKKYILTHENIHIKRKDYFTKLIAYLILTIHWINPICWILFKMFVNDMEMLCDEESIKKLGSENKVGYMESLVNLSARNMKNILPCPIAFSENNTEKRVKNMIKYKKSGVIISIIALIVCVIIAAICLTNKQEVSNIDNENGVTLSLYEQTEEYLKNEFNRVYTPYYEILSLDISNWDENGNEATFFYKMTFKNYDKDPDTVDYIKEAKENGDIERYEILKKEYLEPKEANHEFKIVLENDELSLYSNTAPKGTFWEAIMIDEYVPTAVSLDEWNSMEEEIVYGKLAYREYQTDNYYAQIIKDKNLLEELNDYLFIHAREIKGRTACPFDATIKLGTESGKKVEIQLATDSCTVFKINDVYYEYTENKGEDDPDEPDFYKYFDEIEAYITGEKTYRGVIEKQLNVILNNKNLWYKDTEFEKYSYAVTDLDKNGRIEIISSICQGTGIYTYTEIYEVNESMDGLNICESNLMEHDSQADIIRNEYTVFYDSSNNKYHYIFDDLAKNGATEYYENKRVFCLSDGKINEKYLAYKTTIYQNGVPKVTYTDSKNKEISEAEYNNIENKIFENYEKMIVNIEWLTDYTEIKLENLEYSYNKFLIYTAGTSGINDGRKEAYITNETEKITISYINLTEENINNI